MKRRYKPLGELNKVSVRYKSGKTPTGKLYDAARFKEKGKVTAKSTTIERTPKIQESKMTGKGSKIISEGVHKTEFVTSPSGRQRIRREMKKK